MDISLCHGFEEDPDSVSDAMKSFPSGHAQMSCFAAAFIIVSFGIHFLFVHLFLSGLPEWETKHNPEPPGQVLVAAVAGADGHLLLHHQDI